MYSDRQTYTHEQKANRRSSRLARKALKNILNKQDFWCMYLFGSGLGQLGGLRGVVKLEKVKEIPLQAWTGPEGSRRLRLPDFKTIGT